MLLLFILLACVTDDDAPPVDTGPTCTEEICDGLDNDCDGEIDEDAGDMVLWYLDVDSDGYGDEPITACDQPSGTVTVAGDCDDNAPQVNPSAPELCNGIDDNCDTLVDEGFDVDSDGFRTCDGDCDDANGTTYPGAPELCNGVDDNCDTLIDDDYDWDSDGFTTCEGDCDDLNDAVHPGIAEACNGIDDDCDSVIDNGYDMDSDGVTTCAGDCDDSNRFVYPGAVEVCNDLDDNCDLVVDGNRVCISVIPSSSPTALLVLVLLTLGTGLLVIRRVGT